MQRKKIQEAMKNVYFQKMTANGYHEIEEQIAKLQQLEVELMNAN